MQCNRLRIAPFGQREWTAILPLNLKIPFSPFCSVFFISCGELQDRCSKNLEQKRWKWNIHCKDLSAMPPKDSIDELPFPTSLTRRSSAKPSEIEREVMDLFEQFRDPLLRYALSFGIPVHDAEEVIQEVFLSLFRHLQLRRSRKNLRGWIFRVTHNLALKQRYANQRSRDQWQPRTETIAEAAV